MSKSILDQNSDQFQLNSSLFLEWFTAAKSTRLNPKLELADLRDSSAGRGVVTKADIAEDEELFAVPRSLVLDATNSDLQKQIDIPLSEFGSWNSLIVVIIYEYLRKDISPWHCYFKVLPTTFDTLMFWNPAELAELQGSAVLDKIGRAEAEEGWKNNIIPFMKAHQALFPLEEAADSTILQLAHMAGSLIMAYAFDLGKQDDVEEEVDEDGFVEDDEEDPAKGMVPIADMLNADADRNNARLFHEEEFLLMKATRAINAGDELFNDYGPLPRSDLLRMYGYITDNYAQYDVVEISSQAVYDAAEEIRKKYKRPKTSVPKLEELGDFEEGYAISRLSIGLGLCDAIPTELVLLLSALAVNTETAISSRNVFDLGKRSFTIASADLLVATIKRRLADYKTTISHDDDIIRHLSRASGLEVPSGVHPYRYRIAVQVRNGEKGILHQVLQLAQQFSTTYTNGKRKQDTDDEQPKKAHKARK